MRKVAATIATLCVIGLSIYLVAWVAGGGGPQEVNLKGAPNTIRPFLGLLSKDKVIVRSSLSHVDLNWRDESALLLTEVTRIKKYGPVSKEIREIRKNRSGKSFGPRPEEWYDWIWNQEPMWGPDYADFKARLYSTIDSRFAAYFQKTDLSLIHI